MAPSDAKAIPASVLPQFVQPQLAQLRKEAPAGERRVHEITLDGYRIHGSMAMTYACWFAQV
jgi:ATP-dependent DNA ligase